MKEKEELKNSRYNYMLTSICVWVYTYTQVHLHTHAHNLAKFS